MESTVAAIDLLKVHGSQNDLFVVERAAEQVAGTTELPELVRRLCDRSGPLGGDGVYFLDSSTAPPVASFFNPDGSPAAFCGNGMRCLGRLLLDRDGAESGKVRSGRNEFTVRRAGPTPEGVVQTVVALPPVDLAPQPPIVAGGAPHIDEPLPALHPTRRFTALAVPNSHLVSIVDTYDEAELVAVGERLAASPQVFPIGANVSYVLPLDDGEIFVRTYERGAGLTMSCGSAVAAARAVCSRLGRFAPTQPVVVRNPGGVARAWLREEDGRWYPHIEGNASFVFRATVDVSVLTAQPPVQLELAPFVDEIAAFAALNDANLQALRAHGVRHSVARTA